MGFVLLIYRAGRLVESVNGLDHRLTGVEHTIKDMGKELKDVQTKVTVLWEQRKIS